MIKSFSNKSLKLFYRKEDSTKIDPRHQKKLLLILGFLENAEKPSDMNIEKLRLHLYRGTGKRRKIWSVDVDANWRVLFSFDGQHVVDVDYIDPH